jgi:hypothetical protein
VKRIAYSFVIGTLTRVYEKLIGQSRVIDVVYGSREKGGGDFQWRENALKKKNTAGRLTLVQSLL